MLELRDKVGAGFDLAPDGVTIDAAAGPSTPLGEVREALVSLGYSAGEVQAALADLDPDGTTSDLLRRALRLLGAATGGR